MVARRLAEKLVECIVSADVLKNLIQNSLVGKKARPRAVLRSPQKFPWFMRSRSGSNWSVFRRHDRIEWIQLRASLARCTVWSEDFPQTPQLEFA